MKVMLDWTEKWSLSPELTLESGKRLSSTSLKEVGLGWCFLRAKNSTSIQLFL